jgi:hypothetical protein
MGQEPFLRLQSQRVTPEYHGEQITNASTTQSTDFVRQKSIDSHLWVQNLWKLTGSACQSK